MQKVVYFSSIVLVILFVVVLFPISATSLNKPVYKSKYCEEKMIALTFDDGPHPKKTEEILNVLKK